MGGSADRRSCVGAIIFRNSRRVDSSCTDSSQPNEFAASAVGSENQFWINKVGFAVTPESLDRGVVKSSEWYAFWQNRGTAFRYLVCFRHTRDGSSASRPWNIGIGEGVACRRQFGFLPAVAYQPSGRRGIRDH